MPSYFFEIPDVGSTIQKTVTDSVVGNVLANMGIPDSDIVYDGPEYEEQAHTGSTTGEKRKRSFGNTDKVTVTVEEERDKLTRIERHPGYDLEVPFFLDKQHGVKLAPSMVKYDVNVTVRRRAPSKAIIQNWCNEIQRRTDMGKDMMVTQAEFYYHIPIPALNLLNECYVTQFYNRKPDCTLTEYFKRNFGNNVTLVTDTVGKNLEYVVRNTELRIIGIFDTEGPKPEKGQNSVNWECEFSFKFNYSRPETVEAVYPIMLNNTLVDKKWWVTKLAPGLVDYTGAQVGAFVEAGEHVTKPPYLKFPIYIPECDNPQIDIPYFENGSFKTAIIHLEMEPSNTYPNRLFNLDNLGDEVSFNDDFIKYIKDAVKVNPNGEDSIVKVYIFENNFAVNPDKVAIDINLDVYYNGVIHIERIYRVVIVIETDWSNLTDEGFEVIRRHPKVIKGTLDEFRKEISNQYPIDESWEKVKPAYLDDIVEETKSYDPRRYHGRGHIRDMITVMNGSIITYRRTI